MQPRSKTAVVLDTGALLAKYYRLVPRHLVDLFTTSYNISEVIDLENKEALKEALELGLISVVDPHGPYLEEVEKLAKQTGSIHKLSKTDLAVAALALQLVSAGREVLVITDDYDLQSLLLSLGIKFKPLRTRGIKEAP
ncbi:MAG: NOB1 family endonuclease [Desulfurococcaceae archaeon]